LHEGGLGKAGLPRERAHRLVVHAVGVVHDRERVAGEAPVGEDVQDGVRIGLANCR
jgi:hypothetical protein